MRLLLVILLCASAVLCEIYSCGGFVRSKAHIDFSKIQIKLVTPEGHLKHEEEVNIQNGYYMIPVYNKGQYSLKVSAPDGWHFEPASFDFKLDGVNDPCSKNEDINFSLISFSISGVVESGFTEGFSGLDLMLLSNGQIIASTKTMAGGKYSFKAPPGKYEVAAGADSSVCISRGKASVEVKNAPVIVLPALKISGYELEIAVNNNGKPVQGVDVTMYAVRNPEISGCKAVTSSPKEVASSNFACPLGKTSTSGIIVVACVPSGSYFLRPEFRKHGIDFQFNPPVLELNMKSGKTKVSLSVAGFSVRGQVEIFSAPVSGATVFLNGEQVTTTDHSGSYILHQLQEGNIELTAKAEHTEFATVKTQLKLPNPSIPTIKVTGFELCGSAELISGSSAPIDLVIKNRKSGENISIKTDTNGKFCKMLTPAEYTISPADTTSTLTPRVLDVNLSKGSLHDLRFTHFKTDLDARVDCIGSCDGFQLQLILGDSIVQTVKGTDAFFFKDVAPGKYLVKVVDAGRFCWVSASVPVNVERARPSPVHLEQLGFNTHIKLSHPATLKWSHSEKKSVSGELAAKSGKNTICVPVQGKYQVTLSSCHNFDRSVIDIKVPSEVVAEISAVDALIKGTVISKDKLDFKVLVKSSSGERTVPVVNGVFSFHEPLKTTGNIVLVPLSDTYLFEPYSASFQFIGECIEKAAEFITHKGLFLDGCISPAVEDVKIIAQFIKTQETIEKDVKFETVTDKNGKYRFGPVRRVQDFLITAEKEGYSFYSINGQHGNLTSVRLSKLTVTVSDLGGEGTYLDGVLLSVVGGREYRSNNMIDATGTINFVGLAPGNYFLRPILQEFKFEPSQTTVTVLEGEHQHVELKGRRVAFSAFGRVREMSGSAVPDSLVEALSDNCGQHQSEATTGQDGSFRIRGLKPECEYKVSLKAGPDGAPSPHCFPSHFVVKMTAEHVKDLEMVVAPSDEGFELLVDVDFGTMTPPQSVKLVLFKDEEVVNTVSLVAPVNVFIQSNLTRDGAEYTIRLEAEKPLNIFAPAEVSFNADRPVRAITIPVTVSKKQNEVEISFSSFLSLPFFALLALAFFNQQKALDIVRSVLSRVERPTSPNQKKKKN